MAEGRAKAAVKDALRALGFELQRFDPDGSFAKRRQRLLESMDVDLAIDVGAHAGEFGRALRHGGYRGRILSFEPVSAHFALLRQRSAADRDWACEQAALGRRSGEVEINIAGNEGFSSSLRPMTPRHEAGDSRSAYIGTEKVRMQTLDGAVEVDSSRKVFLKVDAQGYEEEVLAGGSKTLSRCHVVELEVAFVELYANQALFGEIVDGMRERQLLLTDLEPGFHDRSNGELLQADALFVRTGESADNA
jgi:FkbM family methyltransferase